MEEKNHSDVEVQKIFRCLSILNRTRDSLSSSALCPKNGQTLDRALAKQINIRRSELDSLLPNNISVIVRSSTPNPEVCEGNCLTPSFQTFAPPEESSQAGQANADNLLPPSHRHPVIVRAGQELAGVGGELSAIRNHSLAPSIPWSPTRAFSDSVFESQSPSRTDSARESSTLPRGTLSELLSNSDTAPLLAPLFTSSTDSLDNSMTALVDMKDACDAKVRRFTRLLRRYDPADFQPSALVTNKSSWTSEATNALEELVDAIEELCSKHGQTLGSTEVGVWKESIKRNEAEFKKFINELEAKTSDMGVRVPAPGQAYSGGDSNLIQAQKTKAAQVDIEVDMQIISTEGTQLSTEIQKFDDWGDAPDNEIEVAMNKVDDWKRKMEKLREKSYAIQRNTMSFNLDQSMMRSSKALVNTLSSELEIVVDNIQFEDGKRCLYSQNRSKVAAVKFPTFGGDTDEDFQV